MGTFVVLLLMVAGYWVYRFVVKSIRAATGAAVDAAAKGVSLAYDAHKQRQSSVMWFAPGAGSASALHDHLTARAADLGAHDFSLDLVERRGRQVVRCTIAPGVDAEALRANLLRAARESDPSCALLLP